jgi:hypothetical protein
VLLPGQRVTTNGPTMRTRTAHHQNIYLFIHSSSKSIISPICMGLCRGDGWIWTAQHLSIARSRVATKNTLPIQQIIILLPPTLVSAFGIWIHFPSLLFFHAAWFSIHKECIETDLKNNFDIRDTLYENCVGRDVILQKK